MVDSIRFILHPPAGEGQTQGGVPEISRLIKLDSPDHEIVNIGSAVRHIFLRGGFTRVGYARLVEGRTRAMLLFGSTKVSRNHVYLMWKRDIDPDTLEDHGNWVLIDQDSTNGTGLDEERCEAAQPYTLARGQHTIWLGEATQVDIWIGD